MTCLVMGLVGNDDSNRRSFLMWFKDCSGISTMEKKKKKNVYYLFYAFKKTHVSSQMKRSVIYECRKNNIKCVIQQWSDHYAHKHKRGNPLLSFLALFPLDLYPLIKTNQDGILHVDSTQHSRELSHLIWMAGFPSPRPVACSRGVTNLIVLTPAWLREGIQA